MPGRIVLFSWNSMGDIIYVVYDIINILDVMSYLYGWDAINCSCDAMHAECDDIYIVYNVIQRVGVIDLIHWVDDTDTVYVVSDIECEMADITFVFSCVWFCIECVWCHECNGCNVLTTMVWTQRVHVTLYVVNKMSYIKCVWCHTYSYSEILLRVVVSTQILWMQC